MTEEVAQEVEAVIEDTVEQPAEQVETQETEATPVEESTDEKPEKKPKGVQKRLDELTRLRHDAQREAEQWREMALSLQKPAEVKPTAQSGDKPAIDSFENYDDYIEALADWKTEQKFQARESAQRAEQHKVAINKQIEQARKKYADFDEVALEVKLPQSVFDILPDLENGADVTYWLGQNPDAASQLLSASPAQAAIQIGRISERLNRPEATPKNVPPAPPKTVSGMTGGPTKAPAEMSMAEYVIWRGQK